MPIYWLSPVDFGLFDHSSDLVQSRGLPEQSAIFFSYFWPRLNAIFGTVMLFPADETLIHVLRHAACVQYSMAVLKESFLHFERLT